MTNKEKYKRAFSSLHMPESYVLDLNGNSTERENALHGRWAEQRKRFRIAAAAACVVLALCVGGASAYAADLGGIQRTIQVWIHGDQTSAIVTINDQDGVTNYSLTDNDGRLIMSGGGVAMEADGSERPLTESEVQDYLNLPETETEGDRVYLFYKDQKIDITEMFGEDGLCFITVSDGDETQYVTAARNGGMASSPKRYIEKSELPAEWFQ